MSDYPFFFTWTDQRRAVPIHLTGGDGAFVDTADGGRWLDLASFSFQANLGHGHPRMRAALAKQAEELCVVMPNAIFPAKQELAQRLLELAPEGFSRVFFTLGGAEAIENALKIARLVTGRHKLISRYRSYHGASMGALSLSGDWRRPPLEPGLAGVVHALDCYCDRCPFGHKVDTCQRECARHIGDLLQLEGPRSVAAVVLETVVGANGVLIPPSEYWPMVREACDRHGTLLVADEVLSGFGRTGRCFAFEHFDVVPDMICLAKGLTGGYAPLGAVLVHDRVARHFDDNVLACGLTNYAHPLGCAAGVEALAIYADEGLFERAAALGPTLLTDLRAALPAGHAAIGPSRGIGLLAAVELDLPASGWKALAAGLDARRLFVHLYPSRGTVVFAPPLCIAEADMKAGLAGFGEALAEALRAADADRSPS
ncbi:aspartate aminotransferase family protein [Haliangium sp.]|uniref:aminotransferase family protein n=1 Tax=Haliangium sp. TaxID=2663208 RepID=UPI003D099CAB